MRNIPTEDKAKKEKKNRQNLPLCVAVSERMHKGKDVFM